MRTVTEELTQEAARGVVLGQIREAIETELEGELPSFVTVERDGQGDIQAIRTHTEELNALRVRVLERLEERLNGNVTVTIPVGSLTGVALFNGRGFPVPLKLRLESSADLDFSTEFTSAGINQSCHRITMTVRVQAYSHSQRFPVHVAETSSTVLAETVLVGTVPETAVVKTG